MSTLLAAVNAAGVGGPLSDSSTAWTILAPTNDAFEDLLVNTLKMSAADLLADTALLVKVRLEPWQFGCLAVWMLGTLAAGKQSGQAAIPVLGRAHIDKKHTGSTPGMALLHVPCRPARDIVCQHHTRDDFRLQPASQVRNVRLSTFTPCPPRRS
jgi:hypothetical protein